MKRWFRRAGLLLCTMQLGLLLPVSGQLLTLDFIYGGVDDAEKILQEYLKPFANIIGSDLNAGWYNTARPHQLGGLDITATVSWATAPASALRVHRIIISDFVRERLCNSIVDEPRGVLC